MLQIRSAAVLISLLLTTVLLNAQPASFGDAFPLANTRYGTSRGHQPIITSNGHDPVMFWLDGRSIRVSRYANGGFGMSRVVVDGDAFDPSYDAIWTGKHFLVVASSRLGLMSRVVSATGEPLGDQLIIAAGRQPRIAFNGTNALLLFVPSGTVDLSAMLLTEDGMGAEAAPRALGISPQGRPAIATNGSSFAAIVPRAFEPQLLTFDPKGQLQSATVLGTYGSSASIAGDGRRYLAVIACGEAGPCSPAYARLIAADGSIGPPLELDPPYPFQPSAVWSGSEWLVAFTRDVTQPPALHVLHLDAEARTVHSREHRDAVENSLTVIGGQGLAAWVGERYYDTIFAGGLPLAAGVVSPASFTATQQILPIAASSSSGTLVTWQELGNGRTTLHTGVRTRNGEWTEHQIRVTTPRECFYCYEETANVIAASDGQEFLVLSADAYDRLLYRVDADGNVAGEPAHLPNSLYVGQIVWSGHNYLLINDDTITRSTSSGALSASVPMPAAIGQSAIFTTDGDGGLLAVWIEQSFSEYGFHPEGVSAMRLDREWKPIDHTPIALAGEDYELSALSAGWDGQRYVVAWYGEDGVMAAQLEASGPAMPRVKTIAEEEAYETSIVAVSGGVAIHWHEILGPNRIASLRKDGSSTSPRTISENLQGGAIVSLPDGDLGFVEAAVIPGAPFESTSRITMTIGSIAPLPSKPAAPSALARLRTPATIEVTWDAPLEPVSGYRVETRVGDGPWVELESTCGPEQRTVAVPILAGMTPAFRVRAWNSAGLGAYSQIVSPNPRRRAVR